jgi:hypothetical protein
MGAGFGAIAPILLTYSTLSAVLFTATTGLLGSVGTYLGVQDAINQGNPDLASFRFITGTLGLLLQAGSIRPANNQFIPRQQIANIAEQYGVYTCVECAAAILQAMRLRTPVTRLTVRINTRNGDGANLFVPGNPRADGDLGGAIAFRTGLHRAIQIAGRVYDNVFPRGLPRAQWENAIQVQTVYGSPARTPLSSHPGAIQETQFLNGYLWNVVMFVLGVSAALPD